MNEWGRFISSTKTIWGKIFWRIVSEQFKKPLPFFAIKYCLWGKSTSTHGKGFRSLGGYFSLSTLGCGNMPAKNTVWYQKATYTWRFFKKHSKHGIIARFEFWICTSWLIGFQVSDTFSFWTICRPFQYLPLLFWTKWFNHLFCLGGEMREKFLLKLQALVQLVLMKHESYFKSRNHALRSFWCHSVYWCLRQTQEKF